MELGRKHAEVAKGCAFNLEEGIELAVGRINGILREKEGVIVVLVAGGSASGKTTAVAKRLKEAFGQDATVMSMDNYYRGLHFMKEQEAKGIMLNFDQPEVINLDLLKEHLEALKSGKDIEIPQYSFVSGEVEGSMAMSPRRIVILEGLFALNNKLKETGDMKIFVDVDTHGRIIRRLLRDVSRTSWPPEKIIEYMLETVEPMYAKYIADTKANADLVIENRYNPLVEAQRSGFKDVYTKFRITEEEKQAIGERLRKLGATRLCHVAQFDRYYTRTGSAVMENDELIRIRDENGRLTFAYKGPMADFGGRYKFEIEMHDATVSSMLAVYDSEIFQVGKERTIYVLDGSIICIDENISKIERGTTHELGSFVKVKAAESESRKIASLIGIASEGTRKSYAEM